jgi:hypothetical protein
MRLALLLMLNLAVALFGAATVFSLVDTYRSNSSCNIGSGETVLFWKGFWHGNELLCNQFPRLYSFGLNLDDTVADIAMSTDIFS